MCAVRRSQSPKSRAAPGAKRGKQPKPDLTRQTAPTQGKLERIIQERTGRLQEEIARLTERVRLSALGEEVGRALTDNSPLARALQKCAEALVRHLDAAFARIWTVDESGQMLELQASAGMYTRLNGEYSRVPVGSLKVGKIAARRQPHLTNQVQRDPNIDNPAWAKREGMVSFAGHPLGIGDRLLGVVAVFARRPLSELALEALTANAAALALGIQRARAEQALQQSRDQLRALADRLESLLEEERTRISREIHDELGQRLTGFRMDLRWIERKLCQLERHPAAHAILERVVEAEELVDGISDAVQEIAAELRPGVLDKLGLGAALQSEARRFQERTGIICRVRLPRSEPALSAEVSTALFRIFQECLTNVTRHARAKLVEVELKLEKGWVVLSVHDDGHGITAAEATSPKSLGLLGMKERASLLGGEISFQRGAEGGTTVMVRLPLARRSAQEGPLL